MNPEQGRKEKEKGKKAKDTDALDEEKEEEGGKHEGRCAPSTK